MTEEKLSRLKMFTLLLVEDDEELLNKLNVILSIFFKEVITAQNGKDALEIYSTQKIDMIISDYSMPLMSGYELLKEIRKENKKIPLTIISNYSDKEKLLNSIPLSLAHYLIKPIDYTTLTTTLIAMVEKIEESEVLTYKISNELSYDTTKKELSDSGILVPLSKSEIIILELFLKNIDKIVSNNEIERNLDPTENKSDSAIKSLIYRLRKKIGKDKILNIAGFGFMLKL
jgi:two-component system, OmpR family, response regulator VanR